VSKTNRQRSLGADFNIELNLYRNRRIINIHVLHSVFLLGKFLRASIAKLL